MRARIWSKLARCRLDPLTHQKEKLGTWDQTLNEESLLPFICTVFWVSSLPGDFCRAAHIGDISRQHCELCMLESCLSKLVLWERAGIKIWRRVWVFVFLFFFFLSFSVREVMVPSLQWLLLLWGLQGLWAQDYEEANEEDRAATRKKNKQLPSNFITQNGKCK